MQYENVLSNLLFVSSGMVIGFCCFFVFHRIKLGKFETLTAKILKKAEEEAEAIKKSAELMAKQNNLDLQRELECTWQSEKRKMQREEDRLKQREDKIESRWNLVEKKVSDIEKKEALLIAKKTQIEDEKTALNITKAALTAELEKVSGLSSTEAKELLIQGITNEVKTESANLARRIKKEAEENAEREASSIIATAINRLASSSVSESTINTVSIPNEDMKGRIIGREGRNIRALEHATGVNIIIDDTPGAVVLSGFDPIRLQIAKLALQDLVADGRIHPTRIEEAVAKAKIDIQKIIRQHGEDAALRAGAINLHSEIINLLGKLKFRFSYGQNMLTHSLEVSHLMGMMAAELGLDERLAKRIGLLHDMGKAVSHEIEGSHAVIGHDLALRYGESKFVANGIGCHHQEMEALTVEASLCSAADALSASRPGARIEAVEEYIKRLTKLEAIARDFSSVKEAYAMQAGREIRVVVLPEATNDEGTFSLARELTKRIEDELNYPGKIKVTVIRETRAVEYAL